MGKNRWCCGLGDGLGAKSGAGDDIAFYLIATCPRNTWAEGLFALHIPGKKSISLIESGGVFRHDFANRVVLVWELANDLWGTGGWRRTKLLALYPTT
jgi:hypothetical protein